MLPDEVMKKKDRGATDAVYDFKSGISVVKWYDNKPVIFISTFTAVEPMVECRRYDKKTKSYITVPQPAVVPVYNKFMGGVDLSDMLRALYVHPIRCPRWYTYLFLYALHLQVRNAWILYKRHASQAGFEPSMIMPLKTFIWELSASLIGNAKPRSLRQIASTDAHLRYDGMNHLPVATAIHQYCKECRDRGRGISRIIWICSKCKVGLCLSAKRNCFIQYHTR